MDSRTSSSRIDAFLRPLDIDIERVKRLASAFEQDFASLASRSLEQFLPTPISASILRAAGENGHASRHLAIDIGGTNLRVGFVELPTLQLHVKQWPIQDRLKSENDNFFSWVGECIASAIQGACDAGQISRADTVPLGVTFSFPMQQHSLSEAVAMPMGKGFDIKTDLSSQIIAGYEQFRKDLPRIRIVAIANDSVSTLVAFLYQHESTDRKACMGLIVGTGSNATIPLKLSCLGPKKRPPNVSVLPGEDVNEVRIAVNTEWSIHGTAPALRKLGLVSRWDAVLDAAGDKPGFQPLEYMTSGRYLGELGRIMLLDYLTTVLGMEDETFPPRLLKTNAMTTTFLSHFHSCEPAALAALLEDEFPSSAGQTFQWTPEVAEALYKIAKAIEYRAAGIIAASTFALLKFAGEFSPDNPASSAIPHRRRLGVGYTGGCIDHFQSYLLDCRQFLGELVEGEFGASSPFQIDLVPCHEGGIKGAGILVAAALRSREAETKVDDE